MFKKSILSLILTVAIVFACLTMFTVSVSAQAIEDLSGHIRVANMHPWSGDDYEGAYSERGITLGELSSKEFREFRLEIPDD